MRPKIVVFASGSGSNFEVIVQRTRDGYIPAEVSCLITDRADAGAIKRAMRYGIKAVTINWKPREVGESKALAILEAEKPSLIVLAGFMRILSADFVSKWRWKILNIHPSLLPAFEGTTNAVELSAKKGVRISGCTVHFVDETVDGGPIIAQAAVAIDPDDDIEKIKQKVHALEHKLYPMVIKGILEGKIWFDEKRSRTAFAEGSLKLDDPPIFSISV